MEKPREILRKKAGNTGEKRGEIISLSFPVSGSRLPVPVTSFPVM
jgi:hypothetical protein